MMVVLYWMSLHKVMVMASQRLWRGKRSWSEMCSTRPCPNLAPGPIPPPPTTPPPPPSTGMPIPPPPTPPPPPPTPGIWPLQTDEHTTRRRNSNLQQEKPLLLLLLLAMLMCISTPNISLALRTHTSFDFPYFTPSTIIFSVKII